MLSCAQTSQSIKAEEFISSGTSRWCYSLCRLHFITSLTLLIWDLLLFLLLVLLLFLLDRTSWVQAGGVAIFPCDHDVSWCQCADVAFRHGELVFLQEWRCPVVLGRWKVLLLLTFTSLNQWCSISVFCYFFSAPEEIKQGTFKLVRGAFFCTRHGNCWSSYLLAIVPIPNSRNPMSRQMKASPSRTKVHVVAVTWRTHLRTHCNNIQLFIVFFFWLFLWCVGAEHINKP